MSLRMISITSYAAESFLSNFGWLVFIYRVIEINLLEVKLGYDVHKQKFIIEDGFKIAKQYWDSSILENKPS